MGANFGKVCRVIVSSNVSCGNAMNPEHGPDSPFVLRNKAVENNNMLDKANAILKKEIFPLSQTARYAIPGVLLLASIAVYLRFHA